MIAAVDCRHHGGGGKASLRCGGHLNRQTREEFETKCRLPILAIVALPEVLAAAAFAAQDRYSLQVPGGLAFSDFKGYEDWQTIAVSHNGDKLATILA